MTSVYFPAFSFPFQLICCIEQQIVVYRMPGEHIEIKFIRSTMRWISPNEIKSTPQSDEIDDMKAIGCDHITILSWWRRSASIEHGIHADVLRDCLTKHYLTNLPSSKRKMVGLTHRDVVRPPFEDLLEYFNLHVLYRWWPRGYSHVREYLYELSTHLAPTDLWVPYTFGGGMIFRMFWLFHRAIPRAVLEDLVCMEWLHLYSPTMSDGNVDQYQEMRSITPITRRNCIIDTLDPFLILPSTVPCTTGGLKKGFPSRTPMDLICDYDLVSCVPCRLPSER